MKDRVVFLTGATGVIGSYLLKLLLENNNKVYVLARSKKDKTARERVISALKLWDVLSLERYGKNLIVVDGDITHSGLKITTDNHFCDLKKEIEIIFHPAALTSFTASLETCRKINVIGTKNILDFALQCRHIKVINYISTVFVVGDKGAIEFDEDMLTMRQGFFNAYEQSKYEAELLVKSYQSKGLKINIFRPSAIIGDSKQGKINNFNLFYEPVRFFNKEVFAFFPLGLDCSLNLINVDVAAKAIYLLGETEGQSTYHIISPVDTKMSSIANFSCDFFGFPMPKFIPYEKFDFNIMSFAQKALATPFIPYCNYKTRFLSEKAQGALKQRGFSFPLIDKNNLGIIFQYCLDSGYMKKRKKVALCLPANANFNKPKVSL